MVDYSTIIEVDPEVMMGKPVIKGTRITVDMILEELAAGVSLPELVQAHPRLTLEGAYAALAFAADAIKGVKSYPISG
ncbi:MAG: DUF433 domain-containing protein [Bacteroidota bacterium]